jgi:hypothetical protein
MLTITVKNEGPETVLRWTGSCGDTSLGFDLQRSDGNWESFPVSELPVCGRNVLELQRLSPGESYVWHLRLADPALYLDTGPDDGLIHPNLQGYGFLTRPGPHTIRAHWYVNGCVASNKLKPGSSLGDPFAARSLCAQGTEPKQQFIVLQSNELRLSVQP